MYKSHKVPKEKDTSRPKSTGKNTARGWQKGRTGRKRRWSTGTAQKGRGREKPAAKEKKAFCAGEGRTWPTILQPWPKRRTENPRVVPKWSVAEGQGRVGSKNSLRVSWEGKRLKNKQPKRGGKERDLQKHKQSERGKVPQAKKGHHAGGGFHPLRGRPPSGRKGPK